MVDTINDLVEEIKFNERRTFERGGSIIHFSDPIVLKMGVLIPYEIHTPDRGAIQIIHYVAFRGWDRRIRFSNITGFSRMEQPNA